MKIREIDQDLLGFVKIYEIYRDLLRFRNCTSFIEGFPPLASAWYIWERNSCRMEFPRRRGTMQTKQRSYRQLGVYTPFPPFQLGSSIVMRDISWLWLTPGRTGCKIRARAITSRKGPDNQTSYHLIANVKSFVLLLGGPTGRSPDSPTCQSAPGSRHRTSSVNHG